MIVTTITAYQAEFVSIGGVEGEQRVD